MVSAADLGLTAHQFANALGILRAVRKRDWPQKAAIIAVETALAESGMRMLASANVPESQKFEHDLVTWTDDGLGHDHASMGMFQQQTGTHWTPAGFGDNPDQTTMNSPDGWGPPSVLMNAEQSTALFLDALGRIDWQDMDDWVAAQNVQHSAYDGDPRKANNFSKVFGGNYKDQEDAAHAIVRALWDQVFDGEDDDMYLVIDKDPEPETVLLVSGGDIYRVGPGQLAAYRELGVQTKQLSEASYQALFDRAKPLPQ